MRSGPIYLLLLWLGMSSPTASAGTSIFGFPSEVHGLSDFPPPTEMVAKLQVQGRPVLVVAQDVGSGLRLLNLAVYVPIARTPRGSTSGRLHDPTHHKWWPRR